MTPVPVTLHLARRSIWELRCGGLERVLFSFSPLRHVVKTRWNGFLERDVTSGDWVSETGVLSCRVLRSLGSEPLCEAIWSTMRRSAFPGVDDDEWDGLTNREPEGAVPDDVWTDTVEVLVSETPFEGAVAWPIVLTGPYDARNQFRGETPLPSDLPPVIAWTMPPKFQDVVTTRLLDELDPSKGFQRAYWDHPYAGTTALRLDARKLIAGLPERLGDVLSTALPEIPDGEIYPDLEWSGTVVLWIGVGDRGPPLRKA